MFLLLRNESKYFGDKIVFSYYFNIRFKTVIAHSKITSLL